MYTELKNDVYKITTPTTGILVECDTEDDLYRFCAKYVAQGHHITSVVSISPYNAATPRVSVLSNRTYKKYVKEEIEKKAEEGRKKAGTMAPGDVIYTDRFCHVQLNEVFDSVEALMEAGYTEPTYTKNDVYDIRGKSTGENKMVFAAGKR